MVSVTALAEKPPEFQRTTGVNYGTFQLLLGKVEAHVRQYKERHPIHRRGRKSALGLGQSLLLALMYMRQYHTSLSLGQAFSVSESYAHKRYCYMRRILVEVLGMPSGAPLLAGAFRKVAVDVSEQPIERPVKGQKPYCSGEKKAHGEDPAGGVPAHGADPAGALREREGA